MNSQSRKARNHTVRGDYGFARVRDAAFDAVFTLWDKRRKQGMKQTDLAAVLDRDPGWISNQLKGPGNWTLRTFGELVEAMDGEVEIAVFGRDEPISDISNFDAYSVFDHEPPSKTTADIVYDPPIKTGKRIPHGRTKATSIELELELVG